MTHLILDNSSPWTQGPQGPQGLHLTTQNSSPSLDTRTNRRSDFMALYNTNPRANVRIKFREIMNIFQKSKVTVHSESFPPFPKPSGPSMSTTREISLCPISPFSSLSLWQPLLILTLPLLCLLCVFLCPLLKKANISLLLRLGKKVVSYPQICS